MGIHKHHAAIAATAVLLLALVVSIVVMASVPPVSRDALAHHLLVPKWYLQQGRMVEMPGIAFSYYPMNLQMLYAVPLYFGNDVLPKFIHLTFGLLTALILFQYLRRRLGALYGTLGALLFLSLPIIVRLSTVAYVDLGLVFFSTAALMYFVKWTEQGFPSRDLVMSALCCGLCMGTKYNGLIVFGLLPPMAAFVYVRYRTLRGLDGFKALLPAALFITVAAAVYAPWAIRNALWTGNPVYPLLDGLFNASPATALAPGDASLPRLDHFSYRRLAFGEPWWMIALVPVRIFFQGVDDLPQYFDGVLNPYLFVLPVLSLLTWRLQPERHRRENTLWLTFAVLYIAIVFFQIDMRIRWILPAVPPMIILSVFGLHGAALKIRSVSAASRRLRILMAGSLSGVVICLLAPNALYITDLYGTVAPMDTLSGRVTRDEYIAARRPEYDVFRYANQHLPPDASLLALFLGGRYYYSDLPVVDGTGVLAAAIHGKRFPEEIETALRSSGHRFLVMHTPLFSRWLNDNFTREEVENFSRFAGRHLVLLKESRGFALLAVQG